MTENTDPTINISLQVSQANTILAALQELPFKVADPLIKLLVSQANAQLGELSAPPAVEAESTEN